MSVFMAFLAFVTNHMLVQEGMFVESGARKPASALNLIKLAKVKAIPQMK